MKIARMWTLSTAHISRETDKWLTGQAKEPTEGLCVYEKTGGSVLIPMVRLRMDLKHMNGEDKL